MNMKEADETAEITVQSFCFGFKVVIVTALILAIMWDLVSNYKVILFLLKALKLKICGAGFLMTSLLVFVTVCSLFIGATFIGNLFGPMYGSRREKL